MRLKRKRCPLSIEPHPFGIKPEGNLLLSTRRNIRDVGLGNMARFFSDNNVLDMLEFLSPCDIITLLFTSKAFYAFASSEDIWANIVLQESNGDFNFIHSWKTTWLHGRRFGEKGNASGDTKTSRVIHERESKQSRGSGKESESKLLLEGLFSDVLFQKWTCKAASFSNEYWGHDTVERRHCSTLTVSEFRSKYEVPGVPVIITGLTTSWSAMTKWNRKYLLEHFRDSKLSAGPTNMSLPNFFHYADENSDEAPLFIFDPSFGEIASQDGHYITSDYIVPEYFAEDLFSVLPDRPRFRWLLLGSLKSGSKWHVDPNRTNAWNAVITGSKRWMLCPPHSPPDGVFSSADGAEVAQPVSLSDWLLNFHESSKSRKTAFVEATCSAGEVMFIPNGWWHSVMNLEKDTFAITQNYVGTSNVNKVRHLLCYRKDLVSGVEGHRRGNLWSEFDAALERKGMTLSNEIHGCTKTGTEIGVSYWQAIRDTKRTTIIIR